MAEQTVICEGRASLKAAVGVATVGTVLFGILGFAILLGPEVPRLVHYVGAGVLLSFAVIVWPWQLTDARSRKHVLTERSIIYSYGVLTKSEVEIPYSNVQAVSTRRGVLQRIFGVGDVRVSAFGVNTQAIAVTSADANSIWLKSIPDYAEVSGILRERMGRAMGS